MRPARHGSSPTRIMIVDDHRVVSQGLTILFNDNPDFEVCATATTYHEALHESETHKPDVMLVDLGLGDGNGLDLVRELNNTQPGILTIIVSSHDEKIFASRCIRAGAKGYVMKDKPFDVIIDAIQKVTAGELFLSEAIKQQLLQQSILGGKSGALDIDTLSDREFEIFHLIGEGFRQRQIAEKLHISTTTVNKHCQNIRSKLYLESMDELINQSLQWFNKHL